MRERWFKIIYWAKCERSDPGNYGKIIPTEIPQDLQNTVDSFIERNAGLLSGSTLKTIVQIRKSGLSINWLWSILVDLEWDCID